jgi:hypothetical protein
MTLLKKRRHTYTEDNIILYHLIETLPGHFHDYPRYLGIMTIIRTVEREKLWGVILRHLGLAGLECLGTTVL